MLEANLTSLQHIYKVYSTANEHLSVINSPRLLSLGEWQTFIKVL